MKSKRIHRLSSLLGLTGTAAMLALAGCSGQGNIGKGKQQPNEAESPAQQGPVTLSLYINGADISDEELQRYFHEPLKKKLPYMTLEIVRNAKGTSIEELVTSGTFPDLIYTSNPNLVQFKPFDILSDLNGLTNKNLDPGRFENYEWDAIKMYGDKGELYGVPFSQNVAALIYNKDLFDKFAVPYPKENMTWDDVYELAKKLTTSQDKNAYIGIDPAGPWFVGSGLSLNYADAKTNKSVIDSEQWKMVFSMLKQFYEIPGFLGPDNKVSYGTAAFAKDRLTAMNPIWASSLQANLKPLTEVNWDLTTLPNFKGSVAPAGYIHNKQAQGAGVRSNKARHLR
ncbi:ABC transporter substrate-binding protein [Paenibacillus allorhizosphaerae]|uniref:Extracellular solute-binding protein n=1 Tax=Paenibacillus allorhizosphaerae TaxID=2849866 RepID=A0ABM8VJH1_9BACL|nr:extracellular solute-binding protein [Paenibacillus allorhizosphaerae]CAG7645295.1 hypothetical protein PAECIP111802_03481 [Paenibacillus allorhizosphaerae]